MNDDVVTNAEARFVKLPNGDWGARVRTKRNLEGRRIVLIRTRDKQRVVRRLGRQVLSGPDYYLYSLEEYSRGEKAVEESSTAIALLQELAEDPKVANSVADPPYLPERLRELISLALDEEEEDQIFRALMELATYFEIR